MARKPPPLPAALRAPVATAWAASPADVAGGEDRLERVASLLAHGQASLASQSLLPALDLRAVAGDRECELAAAALRLALAPAELAGPIAPKPPDALSAALDRLVALVKRQDEQIRTLQGLLEATL